MKKSLISFLILSGLQVSVFAQQERSPLVLSHPILLAIACTDAVGLRREIEAERKLGVLQKDAVEKYLTVAKNIMEEREKKNPMSKWSFSRLAFGLGFLFGAPPLATALNNLPKIKDKKSFLEVGDILKKQYHPRFYVPFAGSVGAVSLISLLVIRKITGPERRLKYACKLKHAKENVLFLERVLANIA